jgi:flagellar biosynthesis protein FlhA
MPGKQMAIDADLSSGIINEEEAKERRATIQRGAEFYGAMDGATKLVKGDAIVAIIITVINLVAGSIIGMVQGTMAFSEVLAMYSIATVGDGLVSQVPALMISTATGMIVTRAASEGNLNEDVQKQFLSQPKVLVISGLSVMTLTLIPGVPYPQIIAIGVSLILLGSMLIRAARAKVVLAEEEELQEMIQKSGDEVGFYRNVENIYNLLGVDPIEMEFGYSLLPLVDEKSGGSFIDRIVIFRKQYALEMGVVIPTVRLRDNGLINPNQYLIKIKGEDVAKGEVLVDHYLALDPGATTGPIEGIDTVEPAYEIPGKWIRESECEKAEIFGYTVIDPLSVMVTHMSEVVKRHIHELVSRQDIQDLLQNASKRNKAIVEDVVPGIVSVSDLQKIITNLLREGIPVRDMESILQTLGDYGGSMKDTDMLTEYVRQQLKRTITRKYTDGNSIKVITLDQDVENTILNSIKRSEHGTYLAIEPPVVQGIVESMTEQMEKVKELIHQPIMLTSPIVRIYFKKLIDPFLPNLAVLSFSEIDSNIQIQAIGVVRAQG